MPRFSRVGLFVLLALAPAQLVSAHHSFDSEFDRNKPVTLTGAITKIEWANPHGRFFIDIKGPTAGATTWEIELGSVNALMRNGWTRKTLKPGDVVTVAGFLGRDTAHLASAAQFGSITLADGRKAVSGGPFVDPAAVPPGR